MEIITMDGVAYRLGTVYLSRRRTFTLIEGKNRGDSLAERRIRDLRGTGYSYSMRIEPDPAHQEDYDAFFEAISAPVDCHTITLPYGQGTITYEAAISDGSDIDKGIIGGLRRYTGLTVNFAYMQPQRLPRGGAPWRKRSISAL